MPLNAILFYALLVICCAYAFARGGAPERIGAGLFTAGSVLTNIVGVVALAHFRDVEVGVLIVDVVTFLAFVVLAVHANRFWPLWVSALLGLGIAGHLAMWLSPAVIPWAYAVVLSIWSYPILSILAAGTYAHRRRLDRNGVDPPWTRSSVPVGPPMPPNGPAR